MKLKNGRLISIMERLDITITTPLLIWMPIDLLYLYINNGWREPNQIILTAELLLLGCLPILALWRFCMFLEKITKGK